MRGEVPAGHEPHAHDPEVPRTDDAEEHGPTRGVVADRVTLEPDRVVPGVAAERQRLADLLTYGDPATAGDGMAVIILTTSLMGEDKAFDYLKKLEQSAKFHTKGTGYLDVLLSGAATALWNGFRQVNAA